MKVKKWWVVPLLDLVIISFHDDGLTRTIQDADYHLDTLKLETRQRRAPRTATGPVKLEFQSLYNDFTSSDFILTLEPDKRGKAG